MKSTTKGALCYLLWWITGLIFLATEKEDEFVRKNAAQSFLLGLFFTVANVVLGFLPFIGGIVSALLSLLAFVLWILLMVKASQNTYFRIPLAADLAEAYCLNLFK